jgi:hypothetical protein
MSSDATTHRQSASDFGQQAQATLDKATDVGFSLRAVVEVGLGLIQVGLACHESLEGIRRAVERRR